MADIIDTAVQAGTFKTLANALQAAGLAQTLKQQGPFTVFAPTDEAFAKLPKETLNNLMKPENKAQLTKILTYHVIPGRVLSRDIRPGVVRTVEGSDVAISLKGQQVDVNNAHVMQADINADNGVIHVIDNVLLPKE
ncbi:fasciclin domain-containing protein [Anthocerotibacter panamensis]|uniref:fasciclin domain-containing protein n=1 Tax=Anthocerotibacter panamensis TaxID=2857077 RepID=UPI001C404CFF|nr:fasciclin domain-containing protein [Anthocerotibacter panamensis]